MTRIHDERGGAPVGFVTDLAGIEAASVIYLRLWWSGPDYRDSVRSDFSACLGVESGRRAAQTLEELCALCAVHGRRPLMRHSVNCKCLGADESCFANFIGTAATGDRDDAMMFATLLVRPDVAPLITALATEFGLALKRMKLCTPKHMTGEGVAREPRSATLH